MNRGNKQKKGPRKVSNDQGELLHDMEYTYQKMSMRDQRQSKGNHWLAKLPLMVVRPEVDLYLSSLAGGTHEYWN